MKKLFSIFAAVFILSALSAMAADKKNDIVITIDGMICDVCASTLKKEFLKEESVQDISASFDEQTITIDLKEGQDLSDERIEELLEWGGYDLVHIIRVEDVL